MICTTDELTRTLKAISEPCPCKQGKFINKEKIYAINKIAVDAGYTLLPSDKDFAYIYGKGDIANAVKPIIISTHTDTVPALIACYSVYNEDKHTFTGTYDNMGTNAAALLLMKNGNLPDNVFFAFTSDEESGKCNGAKEVLKKVYNVDNWTKISENDILDKDALFISLDVTWEGYKQGCAFSLEGVNFNNNNLINTVNKGLKSFKKNEITYNILPREYTCFDEGVFYGNAHQNACSYCLPTKGQMHDMTGLKVKEQSFLDYINCLNDLILTINKDRVLPLQQENEEDIEKE